MSDGDRLICEECGKVLQKEAKPSDLERHVRLTHRKQRERYGIDELQWIKFKRAKQGNTTMAPQQAPSSIQKPEERRNRKDSVSTSRVTEETVESREEFTVESRNPLEGIKRSARKGGHSERKAHSKHHGHRKESRGRPRAASHSRKRRPAAATAASYPETSTVSKDNCESDSRGEHILHHPTENRRHDRIDLPAAIGALRPQLVRRVSQREDGSLASVGAPTGSVIPAVDDGRAEDDARRPPPCAIIISSGESTPAEEEASAARTVSFTDEEKVYILENLQRRHSSSRLSQGQSENSVQLNSAAEVAGSAGSDVVSLTPENPPAGRLLQCHTCGALFPRTGGRRLLRRHIGRRACVVSPATLPDDLPADASGERPSNTVEVVFDDSDFLDIPCLDDLLDANFLQYLDETL